MGDHLKPARRRRWPRVLGGLAAGGATIILTARRFGAGAGGGGHDLDGRLIPHPQDDPILGSLPAFGRGLLPTFVAGWRECGDIALFRGPRPMVLFAHPDRVREILELQDRPYARSEIVRRHLRGVMGDGMFRSQGEIYAQQRRLLHPILHGQQVSQFGRSIVDNTIAMFERWREPAAGGRSLDMAAEMAQLGLDITKALVFGPRPLPDPAAFDQAVTTATEYAIPRVMALVAPPEGLLPGSRRYLAALDQLDAMLDRAITERRRAGATGDDLIALFLQARDAETGVGMSDQQVRDELKTAIFGLYKSVPPALTWTWQLLSRNPVAGRSLRAELEEVLSGRAPGVETLPHLRYLRMVIDEVLRLYPPLWIMSRPPTTAVHLGGYHLPAGFFVLLCPYITHRHPDFWENPEGFDPERFTPERSAGRHPFAYFPFAAGPRRCAGDALGMLALQLVTATVAQHYRLDLEPGHVIKLQEAFVLRPINGLPMTVHPVADSRDATVEGATRVIGNR